MAGPIIDTLAAVLVALSVAAVVVDRCWARVAASARAEWAMWCLPETDDAKALCRNKENER